MRCGYGRADWGSPFYRPGPMQAESVNLVRWGTEQPPPQQESAMVEDLPVGTALPAMHPAKGERSGQKCRRVRATRV